MTALLEALRSAGLKPTQTTPGAHGHSPDRPPPRQHQPVELPDVSAWDDTELERQAIIHEEEAADISRQLADDLAAGRVAAFGWRGRANGALRYKSIIAKYLKAELRRRNPVAPKPAIDPAERIARENERIARQDQIMAEAAARRAAHAEEREARAKEGAERHRLYMEQQRERKEATKAERAASQEGRNQFQRKLFVDAARLTLSGDQFRAIWQRARDLDPENPCWDPPA
jgi:hypothetical protein